MKSKNFGEILDEYVQTLVRCKIMEEFYNKHHNQEHYVLRNGRIWIVGDGIGKYWNYLCNSREAQRDAHEILKI